MIVTLSVVLLDELLLPLTNATISKINTAPPTTHTHGCVYHSCVSVVVVDVVVVLVDVAALSCAHANARVSVNTISKNTYLIDPCLIKFFILMFLVNKSVQNSIAFDYSTTAPITDEIIVTDRSLQYDATVFLRIIKYLYALRLKKIWVILIIYLIVNFS